MRLQAEIAHTSIATMSLRAFICVHVRLRSFASTVRDRQRARTCVRAYARTYIYTGKGMALLALIIYICDRISENVPYCMILIISLFAIFE